MNDAERKSNLINILVSYAPLTVNIDKIASELSGKENTIKYIVGILYDGLAYGNWPWIVVDRYNRK